MESVKAVFKRRDRLFDSLRTVIGHDIFDGNGIGRLAEAVMKVLPTGCQYDAVYQSFTPLIGMPPNDKTIRDLCWALAGNIKLLRAGTAIKLGKIPATPTSVIGQFLASRKMPSKADRAGFPIRYRILILSGPGTATRFECTLSSRYIAYFATRPDGLGFAGRRHAANKHGRHYHHFSTLVGMRVILSIRAHEHGIAICGLRCSSSLRAYNQNLTEMRWRNGFTCPFDYDHHCHQCPKGQNSCPASCHSVDYVTQVCPVCHTESLYDPAWSSSVCIRCGSLGRRNKSS